MERAGYSTFVRWLQILLFMVWVALSHQVKESTSYSGLFVSNSTHIVYMVTPSSQEQTVVFEQPHGRIVGIAVDLRAGYLFWSDISNVFKGIYRGDLIGPGKIANVQRILHQDVGEVNGLTVDWVSNHLYWTDAYKRSVELSNYDGTNRVQLALDGLVTPRSILADPINGYLYWGDQGSRLIEQSRLDGSNRKVLSSDVVWPNQLALMGRKLYWVDAWSKSLEQIDLSNNSASRVMTLSRQTRERPLFGLTERGGKLYTTVWNLGTVLQIDVSEKTATTLHTNLGEDAMFDAVYVDYNKQKEASHPCSISKAGCSHICLPTKGMEYRCSCPTYGGKALGKDGTTCRDPENILLYAISDQGQGHVGFIDLEGAPSVERTLVAKSLRPVAVGYDPTNQQVYWSDVHERTVHRAFLNGSGHHVFLNHNHSLGVVDGLFVDWKHGNLYYSNMGHVHVERAVFYWHKIEMISLDGNTRKTVVTLVDKPRAIAVDMQAGYLYYSDWGEQARVTRCDLDGSNPVLVQGGLENPNGIVLNGENLFIVDSQAKSRESGQVVKGSLYTIDSSGKKWQKADDLDLGVPFSIANYKNKLYISDWRKKGIFETTLDRQGRPGNLTRLMGIFDSPMGLFYSQRNAVPEMDDLCDDSSRCQEVCTVSPSGGERCSCDSYSPESLAMDNSTCTIPENFLLVSDMNSIKFRSLDQVNKDMSILVRGNSYFSNFAALAYDVRETTVYFSDVNRKTIFSSSIDGKDVNVFHKANDVIDGIALDSTNHRVVWTEFNSGSIKAKDQLGSSAVTTIMTGLSKPRAIQVDGKRGIVYWTEWGKSPKVGQLDINANTTLTLMETEVKEPNGLFLDVERQMLYVGDADKKTVFRCHLNKSSCEELTFMRTLPSHIFDLKVKDDWILYSDWLEHSIMGVSMTTGQQEALVKGLMRPTVFLLSNDGDKDCPASSGCSDLCKTIAGNFLCMCRKGRRLMSDWKTCVDDVAWLPADAFHCQDSCHSNSTCAVYQATVTFSCQCKPGTTIEKGAGSPCTRCPQNYYKSEIGSSQCVRCPKGSSSSEGARSCQCEDGLTWDWQKKACSGAKPGDCPATGAATGDRNAPCTFSCTSDGGCPGARKCCHSEGCPVSQCLDPVGLEHCVYEGDVYNVGQYFSPDNCTRCQCSSIKPSRTTEYGQAICTKQHCPILECSKENQVHPGGQCCPLCVAKNEAHLHIQGCSKDVLTFVLDDDKAYVEYAPTIKITDNRRINRSIRVTKDPIKTNFWWEENGNYLQKVEVIAEADAPDGSTDRDECHFAVQVKDETPPTLICPRDITTYTKGGSTLVTLPSPSAYDNVALSSKPVLNQPITEQYPIGRHELSYSVRDLSNNEAKCSFFVQVKFLSTKCPIPPTPLHGDLECYDLHNSTKVLTRCILKCHSGYTRNSNMEEVYDCREDILWHPHFWDGFTNMACLEIKGKRWWLNGTAIIRPSHKRVTHEKDIEIGMKNLFKKNYFNLFDFTPQLHLNVTRHPLSRLRQFIVGFEVEGIKNATDASYYNQFDHLRQQLERDSKGARIFVHGNGEILSGRFKELGNPELRCSTYEEQLSYACLTCPVGTYFDNEEKICKMCPIGTFQDEEGQRWCKECPAGTTEEDGAYSQHFCYLETSVHVASTKVPTEVIVGVVIGSLVFIIGVVVIVIAVLCIRRHMNDKKVNYIINNRDTRQMEFANRAFDGQNDDSIQNKTQNGEHHANGFHGNNVTTTMSNGSDILQNVCFDTPLPVSTDVVNNEPNGTAKDGTDGLPTVATETVLL